MTIEYLPGKDNTLADALSRQEWVQPVSEDGVQAGLGGCEGPALTGEEETEEDKGKEAKDLRSKRRVPRTSRDRGTIALGMNRYNITHLIMSFVYIRYHTHAHNVVNTNGWEAVLKPRPSTCASDSHSFISYRLVVSVRTVCSAVWFAFLLF